MISITDTHKVWNQFLCNLFFIHLYSYTNFIFILGSNLCICIIESLHFLYRSWKSVLNHLIFNCLNDWNYLPWPMLQLSPLPLPLLLSHLLSSSHPYPYFSILFSLFLLLLLLLIMQSGARLEPQSYRKDLRSAVIRWPPNEGVKSTLVSYRRITGVCKIWGLITYSDEDLSKCHGWIFFLFHREETSITCLESGRGLQIYSHDNWRYDFFKIILLNRSTNYIGLTYEPSQCIVGVCLIHYA